MEMYLELDATVNICKVILLNALLLKQALPSL